MTGNELKSVRNNLGLSQTSVAAMCGSTGGSTSTTPTWTAADVAAAEAAGAGTISNGVLNAACEAVFRRSVQYVA
jgi:transcriptional regulator with XRE-family HTH domain